MSNIDVIRAWKDEEYRNSLTSDQLAALPENPAGLVELEDSDLLNVDGGTSVPCAIVTSAISFILTDGLSCSVNCATVFQGTCGAWSVGCC